MKFNGYVWELYRKSEEGKKAIRRFQHIPRSFVEPDMRKYPFEFSDEYKNEFPKPKINIDYSKLVQDEVSGSRIRGKKEARRTFGHLMRCGIPFATADKKGRRHIIWALGVYEEDWYNYIAAISLGLHLAHPEYFLPYNFRRKFNQLEEIHEVFGIPMPPVPGKQMKKERALYYLLINEIWHEFRERHNLTSAEMCAFLYDFAPRFISPLDAHDLPKPSKAWIITGGSWDIEFADNANSHSMSQWGGNSAIRRGDILVLYLVKPRSSLHSIWRACSDGFIDPFFYYHSTVWISGQIKTPFITFKEMSLHPLLSNMTAVKGHFQGPLSRTPLTAEEYAAILKIMYTKGCDISKLPQLPDEISSPRIRLLNERDVEINYIEPLLKRLGYMDSDWVRQMPVRMGRGERNYPDYAFAAKTKRGEESARMVLESKFQLSTDLDFKEAFFQTKSYALRLQTKVMAMASKEGVWIFSNNNGSFEAKKFIHKTWGEMNHPDGFHAVSSLIGRHAIFGRSKEKR